MRYRFLFFLLVIFLSGCSYHVQVITPVPPAFVGITATPSLQQPSTASVPTSSSTPAVATATLNPTDVFVATKSARGTDTVEPPKNLGAYPIQFDANATYMDVKDSILANTSKTYVVNALKGQVMSVSVHQSAEGDEAYVRIQITGADGTVLHSLNSDYSFWRGALPSSQDYFVTITSTNDVKEFTLRVAIDAPGTTSQQFSYLSNNQNVSFSYTDEFAPVRFPAWYWYKFEPELTLQFIDPKFLTSTNLYNAYFIFGASSDPTVLESCLQPPDWFKVEKVIGDVNINGTKFTRSYDSGSNMGNGFDRDVYRAMYKNTCYEILSLMHYGEIGNYAPELGIKEFDSAALTRKFEAILSTLIIK